MSTDVVESMRAPPSIGRELRALSVLAAPLLATNLGSMMLGVVDTAMVGRTDETRLGAVGLGSSLFFTVTVVGFGWMLALDPLIAQAIGARERGRARHLYWQGLWVALAGAVPLTLALFVVGASLERFGIEPRTAEQTRAYIFARAPGVLPFLAFVASRSFLQAHEITRPLVVGVIVANVVNVPLDYALVFGDPGLARLGLPALGVPAMGTAGAGLASAVATVLQVSIAALAIRGIWGEREHGVRAPDRALVWKTLRLGTPIGLTLLAEFGSFAITAILMGNIGTRALASHNVALPLISSTFQVALALGAAASVRVGHAIGRGDIEGARRSGFTAIGAGALTMSLGAIAFVTIPRPLAGLLTDERAVIEAAVPLLAIASAFQLFDGVQAVAAGVLRGAGDTRMPLLANLAGHYAIGIPIGAALAFGLGWGAVGLWWGLSAGLTTVAIALTARFWILSRRAIVRV